ncbi:MAG: hypothetical protein ACXAB4_03020 [Candidatus Hodarchaeales archaeon]|jgi:endonuclease-3 related protein
MNFILPDINFKTMFELLKEWFDDSTSPSGDFDTWRRKMYSKERNNLPLKIWWPKYTNGDFRLELCIGAILIQRISWPAVRACIQEMSNHLAANRLQFSVDGILSIRPEDLRRLIRPSRFYNEKSHKIIKFCQFLQRGGGLNGIFQNREARELGTTLQNLKCGFGPETRDCALLYAANLPVFVADFYARKLLQSLDGRNHSYSSCQHIFQKGITRDFSKKDLQTVMDGYGPEELNYAICNSPRPENVPLVLCYQQFHAGIVELGISQEYERFAGEMLDKETQPLP